MPSAVDLAYHLKVGELIVAERAVPRTDVLAWTTAGRPWLDQNWGAQVALYGIWRRAGSRCSRWPARCTVVAWGLVVAACRRRTANLRLIAGAVLAGYVAAAASFSPRPQMFSLLLFAAGCTRWRWPGHDPGSRWRYRSSWCRGPISMAPSSSGWPSW